MARRDYKHRASRKKQKQVSAWVWLLVGYLAGAATVGFVWLKYGSGADNGRWLGDRPPRMKHKTAHKPPAPKKKPVPPPNFDFYNLLPDQEVVVPDEELNRPSSVPANTAQQNPKLSARRYLLQVGSVRTEAEADALKAKLAFLGLQAQVSHVKIKGVDWYRVRLGPFSNPAEVQKMRKRLAEKGYKALPIAVK